MTTSSQRRVVVTGLGATTPVGGNAATTWDALLAGRSGVRTLTEPWADALPVHIGAPVAVEPLEVMDRVEARRLDRTGQFALIASREAWAHAGYTGPAGEPGSPEPERLAVVIGTGIGGLTTLLANDVALREKGPRRVSPLAIPMLMPNGPAAQVGLDVAARAGVHTPVSACASGAEAIAQALDIIRSGRADVALAGGTEACVHPLPMAAFANMQALSRRNDEPTRASRPYDTGRDGFVLGEGAAVLVLELLEHAQARGATIYAEIAGAGLSSDAHHIAQPDPVGAGASRAMVLGLRDADVAPADVNHINAHATSTPQGDVAEAAAMRAALGAATDGVAVTATKSITGHLLGAAGAVEALATVLATYHRLVPATINVEDLDPDVGLDVVIGAPRTLGVGPIVGINNSFGFGGHNVALVVRSSP